MLVQMVKVSILSQDKESFIVTVMEENWRRLKMGSESQTPSAGMLKKRFSILGIRLKMKSEPMIMIPKQEAFLMGVLFSPDLSVVYLTDPPLT